MNNSLIASFVVIPRQLGLERHLGGVLEGRAERGESKPVPLQQQRPIGGSSPGRAHAALDRMIIAVTAVVSIGVIAIDVVVVIVTVHACVLVGAGGGWTRR